MFCTKCGREIDDSAKFCNFCGNNTFSYYKTGKNYAHLQPAADLDSKPKPNPNPITDPEPVAAVPEKSNNNLMKTILISVLCTVAICAVIGAGFLLFNTGILSNKVSPGSSSSSTDESDHYGYNEEPASGPSDQTEEIIPAVVPEEWEVFYNSEEIGEISHLLPIDSNMYSVYKYTWSSHNVLTLAFDATYIFQSLFNGLDVLSYINQHNIEYLSNIELKDAAGKCITEGYYIPAEYAEKTLEENAEILFGIDAEVLRKSSYYNAEKDAYLYQTGLGGGDFSSYEIEKVVLYDSYAFVYQRLWSEYNPDTKKEESYQPRSYGCVTILMQDSESEKYHFVSNFAVKNIDSVIDNTFYNTFYIFEPESYEFIEKHVSYVTAGSGLRIRTGPSEDYDPIITIPLDAPVLCLAERQGWVYVRYNTVYGWMSSEYLRD